MTVVRRSPHALWRAVPGHLLLCGPDAEVLDVTGSGALVWELLEEPTDDEAVVEAVASRCGETVEVVRGPVLHLLGELQARSLVVAT